MAIMTPWYTELITGKTYPRITLTMLTSRVAFDHNYADVLGNTELTGKTHPYTTLTILTSREAPDYEYDNVMDSW